MTCSSQYVCAQATVNPFQDQFRKAYREIQLPKINSSSKPDLVLPKLDGRPLPPSPQSHAPSAPRTADAGNSVLNRSSTSSHQQTNQTQVGRAVGPHVLPMLPSDSNPNFFVPPAPTKPLTQPTEARAGEPPASHSIPTVLAGNRPPNLASDPTPVEAGLTLEPPSQQVKLPPGNPLSVSSDWQTQQDLSPPPVATTSVPANGKLFWWKSAVSTPILAHSRTSESIDTQGLVYNTVKRSPRIRAISQNPLIREMQVIEAEAEFDTTSFLQTQFQDRVDPVGDNLSVTNDGTNFLDDHIWNANLGVRRKLETGATYEVNQQLGFRNSNLAFFNPQDQGTATLAINVTQPLLRGRGRYFNRSQILIAQKTTDVAWNTFKAELQNEIQQSVEAYWRLYFDRSVFLQKQRNVQRAKSILEKLEGRAGLDSLPSQIARARSAVLSRKTELANARRDIRNSETEIRRLIFNEDWQTNAATEMLPIELPQRDSFDLDLAQVITTALEHRNEIKEMIQRAKIAAIQRDISTNELLPELSFLLGSYISTLQGDSQIGDAFVDQFFGAGVKPGYSVGLEFEMPIGNRSAKSRMQQREFQLNRIKAEVDETMQNIIAEAQVALRRVESAHETMNAATEAMTAANMDLEQSIGRWEAFALVEGDLVEGQSPTTMLDQLLDAQDRLTAAEYVFAQAELELKNSETALQRTMGTLLMQQQVDYTQAGTDPTPSTTR